MKTDKRVIGLALISFIVSALIVFSFAREVSDEPVEIIKNEFPSPGGTTFTFALVAREDIEKLELRYSVMYPENLRSDEIVEAIFDSVPEIVNNYQINPRSGTEDVLNNIRRLLWFKEEMANQGILPENYSRVVDVDDFYYDLIYYDYSPVMDHVLGINETAGLPLVYGSLVNSTGNFYYMEGSSAFYTWSRIKGLSISHNDEKVSYAPDHQVSGDSEELPISTAPRGILDFYSVKKDDTISVLINIHPFPAKEFVLQIIKIYADGDLCNEPILNVVR